MSQNQPIEILSDQEEKIQFNKKVQKKVEEHKLRIASMAHPFDIQIAVAKFFIPGSQEEKQRIIRERILKFFSYGDKCINLKDGYFEPRLQPNYSQQGVQSLKKQIILYGVDFLKTKRIRAIFKTQNPDIFWLNDSHCKLVFTDQQSAKNAILENLKNEIADGVKIQAEDNEIPKIWFELNPYYQLNFERQLFARYATSQEINVDKKPSNKYFQQYLKARQKFDESFLNQDEQRKCSQLLTIRNRNNLRRQSIRRQHIRRSRSRSRSRGRDNREGRNRPCNNNWRNQNDNQNRTRPNEMYTYKNKMQEQVNRKRVQNNLLDQDSNLSFERNITKNQIDGTSYAFINQFNELNFQSDPNLSFQKEQQNQRNNFTKNSKPIEADLSMQRKQQQAVSMSQQNFNTEFNMDANKSIDNHKKLNQSSSYKAFHYSKYMEESEQKQKSERQHVIIDSD